MRVIALDPGSERTAWVVCDVDDKQTGVDVHNYGYDDNQKLIDFMPTMQGDLLAVEYMTARGMPTAQQEFDTMFVLGRMVQAWCRAWVPVLRRDVKMQICGTMKAKDSNIRASLMDMFGGKDCVRKGGGLYKLNSHGFQALGVALTAVCQLPKASNSEDTK